MVTVDNSPLGGGGGLNFECGQACLTTSLALCTLFLKLRALIRMVGQAKPRVVSTCNTTQPFVAAAQLHENKAQRTKLKTAHQLHRNR